MHLLTTENNRNFPCDSICIRVFGLKSRKVFWDLLYRIGEEREVCLRPTTLQEKKKNL